MNIEGVPEKEEIVKSNFYKLFLLSNLESA